MDIGLLFEWIATNGLPSAAAVGMFVIWRRDNERYVADIKALNERHDAAFERLSTTVTTVLERHTETLGGLVDAVNRQGHTSDILDQVREAIRGRDAGGPGATR